MAKHTFKMSDVTGDARLLARSALGYDFNYFADDEFMMVVFNMVVIMI